MRCFAGVSQVGLRVSVAFSTTLAVLFVAAAPAQAFDLLGRSKLSDARTSGLSAAAEEPVDPEQAALADAKSSGERVEIVNQRSEHVTGFAYPDGHTGIEYSVGPVRTRQDGELKPIDTTVHKSADGRVRPGPTSVLMNFSGGGSGPLATVHEGDKKLDVAFPKALPVPVLTGSTITYPAVWPDVDLKVTVDRTGFRQVLVIKTPQAAAALPQVTYGIDAENLTVTKDAGGNVTAKDRGGKIVFGMAPPTTWDTPSGQDPRPVEGGGSPAAESGQDTGASASDELAKRPGNGSQVDQLETTVATDSVTVALDPTFAQNARYPIYVDPSWTGYRVYWAYAASAYPNQAYWNTDDWARAGYATGYSQQQPSSIDRSWFWMDTSAIGGKQISYAVFRIRETYSWSCSPRELLFWQTDRIDGTRTWNNQGNWISHVATVNAAHGYSPSACPAEELAVDLTWKLQEAANGYWPDLTIGLTAADEGDVYGWKKFENSPVLQIEYNTPPDTPSNVHAIENEQCTVSDDPPVIYTTTPTLQATITDPDAWAGQAPRARFEWYLNDEWPARGSHETGWAASGSTHYVTIPDGTFQDGDLISVRVQGDDFTAGPWSSFCDYRIDTSPPNMPTVSSTQYPENTLGQRVGTTGSFTFGTNGSDDVTAYLWSLNVDPPTNQVTTSSGTASETVQVAPRVDGPNTLFVRATDAGGNLSEIRQYVFQVNVPEHPVSMWQFDENQDTVATDRYNHDPFQIGGTASWDFGVVNGGLSFPTGQGWAASSNCVLCGGDYTVAGWVKPDTVGGSTQTVWAQLNNYPSGATRADRAALRINAAGKWVFSTGADRSSDVSIASSSSAVVGEWTHVTVTYQSDTRQMKLYINGALAGTATAAEAANDPITAAAVFMVGETYLGGSANTFGERLTGTVDETQLFTTVSSGQHVQTLYQQVTPLTAAEGQPPSSGPGSSPEGWVPSGPINTSGVAHPPPPQQTG